MVKVAFFGHNSNEPAVRKRARLFLLAGIDVIGIMPHRGAAKPTEFGVLSLGETHDNRYFQRFVTVIKSFLLKQNSRPELRDIDVIYARNLDMLACAHAFKFRNRLSTPVIYECLDIHNLMTGTSYHARALRLLEGALMKRSKMLVYSSERFLDSYFALHHSGHYEKRLVENRLNAKDVAQRPKPRTTGSQVNLRVGWIGNLRCRHSFQLLSQLVNKFGSQLKIEVHGYPAPSVFPDFENEVSKVPNMTFYGPYNNETDLTGIFESIDLIWAADWYEKQKNSVWQSPNRIYEGGYFGVPAIAVAGTETARLVGKWNGGWAFDGNEDGSVADLIAWLLDNPEEISQKQRSLLAQPLSTFIETPEETRSIIRDAMEH